MLRQRRPARAIAVDGRREAGVIARHPREFVALAVGVAAAIWIVVNALFLQAGPHPAPLFSTPKGAAIVAPPPAGVATRRQLVVSPPRAIPVPAPAPARSDPIAAMVAPSKQMMAVQRALSEFGYGQISPDGHYGPATRDAIMRFERQHRLPVTGQVSDPLLKALKTMTGIALD